jgi:glycosyltransferase domain-containing protein
MRSDEWIKSPLIIFGASRAGIEFLIALNDYDVNIIAFSDNDPKKWGTDIAGIKVISPDEIKNIKHKYYIFIASMYRQEIFNTLVNDIEIDPRCIKCFQNFGYSIICKSKNYYRYNLTDYVIDAIEYEHKLTLENGKFKYKLFGEDNFLFEANRSNKSIGVLIYTRNTEYIEQALTYYTNMADKDLNVNIYILDASTDEYYEKNSKIIDSFESNIMHYRFDFNSTIAFRVYSVLNQIKDEYVTVCPDDDFHYKEAIISGLNVLQANNSIDVVTGKVYGIKPNSIFLSVIQIEKWDLEDPLSRFESTGETSVFETQYSLFRKDVLSNIFSNTIKLESLVMQDTLCYFLTPLYGRVRSLDMPMNIRESSVESLGSKPHKNFLFNELVINDTLESEVMIFNDCVANRLIELGMNVSEAKRLAQYKFNEYMKYFYGSLVGDEYFELLDGKINFSKMRKGIYIATEIFCINQK